MKDKVPRSARPKSVGVSQHPNNAFVERIKVQLANNERTALFEHITGGISSLTQFRHANLIKQLHRRP